MNSSTMATGLSPGEERKFVPTFAVTDAAPAVTARRRWRWKEWLDFWESSLRFYWNKCVYGYLDLLSGRTVTLREGIGEGAILREIEVYGKNGSARLKYVLTRDRSGCLQVFQPPWFYLENHCVPETATTQLFRRLLARLPAQASVNFVLSTHIGQPAAIVEAFRCAGIKNKEVETFFYKAPPGTQDVIQTLTGNSIKGTLRRAERDLEVIAMTPRDFTSFHAQNIEAMGKISYRDFGEDLAMLEYGVPAGHARIFASRARPTAANPNPLVDAAIACTINADRDIYKLWRLTRRPSSAGDGAARPHPDAAKLLVLAAMQDATARGLSFDTDGTTPGMTRLFALFGPGVFRPAVRLQWMRATTWALIYKEHPRLVKTISRLTRPNSSTSDDL